MFMPLFFAEGMAEGYLERVAEKKEELQQIKAVTTKYMLETGLAKIESRRERLAEANARVKQARNYGFSRRAAMALEMSDQLAFELDKLEKLGPDKIAPQYVEQLTTFLEEKVDNDEDLAAAVARGLQGGSLKDDQELSLALIGAMGDMNELQEQFLKTTTATQQEVVPRFNYQSTKGRAVTPSERSTIDRQIARSLNTLYTDSFSFTDSGDVVFNQNADPDVQTLFNTLTKRTVDLAEDPFAPFSSVSAMNSIIESIQGSQNVPVVKVIEVLDEALVTPDFNWSPFRVQNNNNNNDQNNNNSNNSPTDDT